MERASRYLQIADTLRGEVDVQAANSLLPTEHELARRFAVSRVTIRRALGLLERGGLVSRQRGRGTIVSPPKITRHLFPMRLFEEDLRAQGVPFETRVLEFHKEAEVPAAVRERLQVSAAVPVGFVALLRLVQDRAICHDRRYFPTAVAEGLDPFADGRTLPERLRGRGDTAVVLATWDTEIVPAPREVARALGITPGSLVVANRGVEYLRSGIPLEVVDMYYRIDRVRFRFASMSPTPPSI